MNQLLATAALLASLPAANPPQAGTPVVGLGIVSVDQKTIFLPGKSGIEALDINTGRVLWTNKEATNLAGASDKLVLAWFSQPKQANEFCVVVVDAATGKTISKSNPIQMPNWASSLPTYGRSFRTAARIDGDSVVVAWEAQAFYAGGAPPTPEIIQAAQKNESGLVKFDPMTGRLTPVNSKPKDTDFATGPSHGSTNRLGEYEFRLQETIPTFKAGEPRLTTVTLTVVRDSKVVWSRELAGKPFLPPLP